MIRKSVVYGAKKQYDATAQRWQSLINRFAHALFYESDVKNYMEMRLFS